MKQESGWIKVYRSLLKWEWYDDINVTRLFMHMLLRANYESQRWHGIEIPRGSFVSSLGKLAIETGLSVQQIRTGIDKLVSTGEITQRTTPKYSVFTIKNYLQYQDGNTLDNKQITNNQQADNKQSTNSQQTNNNNKRNKEREEYKEPKKERSYYPGDAALDEAFRSFVEMRTKIKQPMTDRAIDLAMARLKRMASDPSGTMDNDLAIRILEQSVRNNWRDIYELKEEKNSTKTAGQMDLTAEWRKYI